MDVSLVPAGSISVRGDRQCVSVDPVIPDIVTYFSRWLPTGFSPGCPICLAFNWGRPVSVDAPPELWHLSSLFSSAGSLNLCFAPFLSRRRLPRVGTSVQHMCFELGINDAPPLVGWLVFLRQLKYCHLAFASYEEVTAAAALVDRLLSLISDERCHIWGGSSEIGWLIVDSL